MAAAIPGLFDLSGRVALVTGASSGIGARCAAVLHAAGADLVITARRSDRLDELAAELGTGVLPVPGDLRESSFRTSLVDGVRRTRGRLDILVNCAGVCDQGPLESQTLTEIGDVLEVNLLAAVDLCRLSSSLLFQQPSSTVINVASIYGLVSSRAPMAGYNTSKGALVQFTRQLAAQWGDRGVRVNALAPGFFPTELTGGLTDRRLRTQIEQRTLLGRCPDLAEIDGPVLFLASRASSYLTGQVLTVDGGWTAA